jgi:8-hydroxy-5-deazaflavin:NADPH oxidoreductase
MRTAIIGLGNIGGTVAANLIAGGQEIMVADKGGERAQAFAGKSGGKARAVTLPVAIAEADILVLAISFDAIKELLAQNRDKLAGKIIVDPSNPIAPDGKGGFRKIIPENQSSGQILAGLLPRGAKLVKAFGTLGAASLKSGANRSPERAVLFYASDDEAAGKAVAELIRASGFAAMRVGGIDQSIRLEVFGDLHEFGKLGRLVSAKEAAALI